MAYTQAQPPKSLADVRDSIALLVVPRAPSALLQANAARRQIELIVRHQNILGRNLVEIAELAHRYSAAIHICRGLQQDDILLAQGDARGLPGVLAVVAKLAPMAAREQVHEPETRIVARDQMFGAALAPTHPNPPR